MRHASHMAAESAATYMRPFYPDLGSFHLNRQDLQALGQEGAELVEHKEGQPPLHHRCQTTRRRHRDLHWERTR
jgi:hypothetical protein